LRACMTGTRAKILKDVDDWLSDDTSPHSLLWVHGHPGSGKSAIATSVAQSLHRAGALGASFFCKHDDEKLQDPALVMPTLVHQLAQVHKAYGKAVVDALGKDPHHGSIWDAEFKALVEEPIALVGRPTQTHLLVMVVDALDECETEETSPPLLLQLVKLSKLAPWLKVIVTSRTLKHISDCLEGAKAEHKDYLWCLDLDAEGPADDLLHVTKHLLRDIKPHGWPGESKMDELVIHADGLFIWIKVACGLLTNTMSPEAREKCLEGLLSHSSAGDPVGALRDLYVRALKGSLPPGEVNQKEFTMVAGAIVAATNPLPEPALAALLGRKSLHEIIECLQSVLYVDSSKGNAVRICHASFKDFLTDTKHCPPEFYIDQHQHHATLAKACLNIMANEENGLRFNVCNLESSHLLNAQVPDLENRVEEAVSAELEYGCLYWAHHLAHAEKDSQDLETVELLAKLFLGPLVLYWLEALSLMNELGAATPALLQAGAWIAHTPSQSTVVTDISMMATDVRQFLHYFYQPILQSTPHLYLSALPFAPMHSGISERFLSLFTNTFKVIQGQELNWPSLLNVLQGGTQRANSVAWSPDGCHIVSGSEDSTICIWDAKTGQLLDEPLRGHTDCVTSVAYSPDGCQIASGSMDKTICIWDAKARQLLGKPLKHTWSIMSVAYSPDGSHIVSGLGDNTICIWDVKTGQLLGEPLRGHTKSVSSVAYSPDGHHIVSGSYDKTVCIWDVKTRQQLGKPLQGHTGSVYTVAYSPDGSHIVSGSYDFTICIWDAKTRQQLGEPLRGHLSTVTSVAYSPDGCYIVSGSLDETVCIWDAKTRHLVGEPLKRHTGFVLSVAYSPDGCHIVSGSHDHTICIWDAKVVQLPGAPLKGHTSSVSSVAFSPKGCHIVSGSWDKTICIWDAKTTNPVGSALMGHTDKVTSVAYSPDGHYIVSGSYDQTICIWDANTGQLLGEPLKGHTWFIFSVAYSPDGCHIVSGSAEICIWDVKTRQLLGEPLRGHTMGVNSVAYSPDSCYIVSGSDDNTICIWDAKDGQLLFGPLGVHTESVRSVAYSPDGCHIVSGSWDNSVCIWDATTGQVLGEPLRHTHPVHSVAYSPDGCHIVSGAGNNIACAIYIWDAKTRQLLGEPLKGHSQYDIYSVAYSPDGCYIVSGGWDKSLRIWD
ncbi:hypothetical protein BOTBODRAFT_72719, partial [Botryobasidium botryosum FD-172 SS1]